MKIGKSQWNTVYIFVRISRLFYFFLQYEVFRIVHCKSEKCTRRKRKISLHRAILDREYKSCYVIRIIKL